MFIPIDFCKFRIPEKGGRVIWEVTNECNYACSYCIFASTGKKPEGELHTEKVFKTLEDLKLNGFSHIKFTGGEPFIRPDMLDILKKAKDLGFFCDISTNASFLNNEIVNELEKLDLEMVHISLDGHNKEIHEAVRGKKSFEPTYQGLSLLFGKKIKVRVGCVIHKFNENYLEDMINFCESLSVNELVFSMMEPVGRLRGKEIGLATKSVNELSKELNGLISKYTLKVSHNLTSNIKSIEEPVSSISCPGGQKFLFINSTGDVSPCTWITERAAQFVMGNLYQNTLSELKQKETYQLFRKSVEQIKGSCPAEHNLPQLNTVKFHNKSKVYSFATENLEYLTHIDLKGKTVLTVGASLDHNIVSKALGAKKVVNFDINENAYYYAKLKCVGLNILSYKEYLDFFMRGDKAFNKHVFSKLQQHLDNDTLLFFQSLYHTYKKGSVLREEHLFNNLFDNKSEKIFNSYYLRTEEMFNNAKEKMGDNINWIMSDILDFNTTEKFDVILLSNIADYSHKMFLSSNHVEKFKSEVVDKFYNYLNENGKIVFAYIFDYHNENNSDKRNMLNNQNYRKSIYKDNYSEIPIKSAMVGISEDAVCLLEKK